MDVSKQQSLAVGDMGNIHIVAIPGSGKTRTIIAKVKVMRERGYSKIFLVTYTNASAAEMKERLIAECGADVLNEVHVSTFHALMIRHFQQYLPQYQLMPPEEQSTILHQIYVRETKSHEGYDGFEEYILGNSKNQIPEFECLKEIYLTYIDSKHNHTLDNIISSGVSMMLKGELPRFNCNYLMVDEFQDVDEDQVKLVFIHGKMNVPITTVGDDDQSIYGWRNALGYKGFVLQEKVLKSTLYKLTTNYRSRLEILTAAFNMIENNLSRIPKDVIGSRGEGGVIEHHHFHDRLEEAKWIAKQISTSPHVPTLILARTNNNLNYVEMELIEYEIPYNKKDSGQYFNVIACKLYISALRAMATNSEHGMQRILDIIFESYGQTIPSDVVLKQSKLFDVQLSPQQKSLINALCNSYQLHKAGRTSDCIRELSESMRVEMEFMGYKLTQRITELGSYLNKFKGNLSQRLTLMSQKNKEKEANVTLMTMHSAKGLERERIYITNFSNRIIPSTRTDGNTSKLAHIEEERRLAFVAITRGKEEVYITSCQNSDSRKGWFGPSEFIQELGEIPSSDHT